MAYEMSHSDTGAAPGPSGYASNFIQVLATDTACVAAMAVLIGHIVNDKLPATVRSLLNTCVLVSLEKADGGRRPVAIGDMFYRMAARFALSLVLEPAQRALSPYQFAVGTEDGCAQVVQSLQHLLSLPPARPPPGPRPRHEFAFPRVEPRPAPAPADRTPRPLACLSIDIANAFNSVDRAVLLRAVYGNPELAACWRMVAFGYGRPNLLLMQCGADVPVADAFIESSNGVRQGDPLAALLFCLAMHPVYAQVAQICRSGCFAFSDDSHGVGWLEECWRAWELLPALLAPLGLQINPAKCELTCFYTDALQHPRDVDALEAFRSAGVTINTEAVKVLGCVVGANDAVIARELRTRPGFRADQRVSFQRLPLMRKQSAYLALANLTGTVLNNRLRAMSPSATEEHAIEYDREVLRIAHSLVGIREVDGDRYDEQLRWSTRDGGFSLHSAERMAPAAYLAGAECTLRSSPVFASVWRGDGWLEGTWPITAAIKDALRRVAAVEAGFMAQCAPAALAGVGASVLPATADTFVAHFKALPPGPIQSAIIHRISTLSHNASLTAAGAGGVRAREEVARLQALKAKESSRWLRVLPTDAGLRLTDLQWQTSAQFRLGVPLPPHGDAAPPCSHSQASATDGRHALVCRDRSSAAMTTRHHAVVNLLKDAAELLKIPARTEPSDLCEDSKLRPDIQLDLPEYTLLSDVTISHPCAISWRKVAAARGVEAVGDARSAEKDGKYADLAAGLDAKFTPFVLYTYGGMHKSALSVIDALGAASDPGVTLVSLTAWKKELKDRVAVCVQRHTANMVIRDAQRARMASIEHRLHAAKPHKSGASRRSSSVVPSSGRALNLVGQELFEPGPRAVSLCAPLLASSYVVDGSGLMSPRLSSSLVPGSPEEAFVPGTPAMDDDSSAVVESVRIAGGMPISRACVVPSVTGMPVVATDLVLGTPETDEVHTDACVSAMSDLCISRSCAEARAGGMEVLEVVAESEESVASAV
jgi:hypothetical protein